MNRILKILFYSFINTIYIWETLKGKVQLNLLETINQQNKENEETNFY